jgi:glutamine phosphoribosylpyrophosphate amidotransferase
MKKTYFEKLKSPLWQKRRLEVMERDDWKCRICYAEGSTLAVHHIRYPKTGNPWDSDACDLVTLCESCHTSLHDGTISQIGPLISSFYSSLIQGRLSNDSDSLSRHIETATDRYLLAIDELEMAITPLRARLFNIIEMEASK